MTLGLPWLLFSPGWCHPPTPTPSAKTMTRCQSCKTRHGCFGYPGESPVSCAAHKQEGMIDVVHPRCRSVACAKRPSFGPPGGKPLACATHRSPEWVDLKNKRAYHRRCKGEGCQLIPVFGSPDTTGRKGALRCAKHRLEGEVDVIHPRCEEPGTVRYGNSL